ncbi:MAG: DNA translocase FtsK 4TM domain-containing protein [Planctomycetes bacterium]|nr:DNA translocase FtsK 4TM domain-containing protein [Planctomycetota bacterium]
MKQKQLYGIALKGFALAACIMLLCSCMSFSIWDAPSREVFPTQDPPANWCGSVGAYCAYYLLYYLGPGVFVLLISVGWVLAASLGGVKITQPALRLFGLCLLVLAVSCTWYLLWPARESWPYSSGGFIEGNGGILGITAGSFLARYVAKLGTVILVLCTWIVGAVLLADTVVVALLCAIGRGAGRLFGFAVPALSAAKERSREMADIWKRLSARQKQQVEGLATAMRTSRGGLRRARPSREVDYHDVGGFIELEHEDHPAVSEALEEKLHAESEPKKKSRRKSAVKDKKKKTKIEVGASRSRPMKPYVPKSYEDYELPSLELLKDSQRGFAAVQEKMVGQKARVLEELLSEFGVNAHVVNAEPGPAITMYELELAPGIKVSQISNLANDMARALSAGSVRVVAPLAGRHTIGIEVPNTQREIVRIKDLIMRAGSRPERMYIPLFLGKSSSGEVLVTDLAAMPHLLIAGTTGSGKSVCINTIVTSILLTKRPDEVKLVLIDPKMVEMAAFESIPHLMCPTVTDTKRAEQILEWATTKMDERYELLAEAKVRNIASYNKLGPEEIIARFEPTTAEEEAKIPKMMPHLVIIIDELADLMMTAGKEIEAYIVRLAQKSRAVGIHLVVATQRPQATVVTGLIKSNMPSRIAFRVASRMDSRIILDQNGGETLLGQGDMLFMRPGTSDLIRAQGAFVDDREVKNVVRFLQEVAEPQFHPELMQLNRIDTSMMASDEFFEDAVQVVLETQRGSVSLLQRRLGIGYARASRIIEMMGASGILGEYKGSQAREVTMTLAEYEEMKKEMTIEATASGEDLAEGDDEEYDEADDADADEEADDEEDDEDDEYDEEEVYADELVEQD